MRQINRYMADDAPALPPHEKVEAMSLENPQDEEVDLDDAAAEDEAAAAEDFQEPEPLTAEEAEARGVAQHLLTNAPPGEFQAVLDDVAALAPGRALEEGFVAGVARLRNAQLLEAAVTPDGARVVLCRAAEVSPTTYRDTTGTLYEVDHTSLNVVPGGTDDEDHALAATKQDIQKALAVYAKCDEVGAVLVEELVVVLKRAAAVRVVVVVDRHGHDEARLPREDDEVEDRAHQVEGPAHDPVNQRGLDLGGAIFGLGR